ncbi:hypothetical protein [Bacillus piscicola]|uniref:hypothetical protein n=1 Tax=Bacillus piscicola TaxID=1632684 RepID=UPI001F08D552|nr:hypothetical protein [Bacillus piscicola]
MSLKVTVSGKPIAVRPVTYDNQALFCVDFEEKGNASVSKDLPKASAVMITALLTKSQWSRLKKEVEDKGEQVSKAEFMIEGDVTVDMPMDIVEGEIGVICSQATYTPGETKGGERKTEKHRLKQERKKEGSQRPEKKFNVNDKKARLHAEYDGVCQDCGQHCDKKVMAIKERNGKEVVVCFDCAYGEKPRFSVSVKFVELLAFKTGMSMQESQKHLEEFPSSYAFIHLDKKTKTRTYWSWDPHHPILKVTYNRKGYMMDLHIRKNALLPTTLLELPLSDLWIPEHYAEPNPKKIEGHMTYYREHHSFDEPVLAQKKDGKCVLMDGYSRYVAAKKMNHETIKVEMQGEMSVTN